MTHPTPSLVAPRLRKPGLPCAQTALAAALAASFMIAGPSTAQAAVASVCTGVSLPPSVVTNIIGLSLAPVVSAVDPLNLLGLNSGLASTLSGIASGQPIGLQAIDTSGNPINVLSDPTCDSVADTYAIKTPKGISIGGNKITGLGNGATASAGELNSIAFGNGAATDAAASNSIAIGPNASVGAAGANSVALGSGASATLANSVALGAGSTTATGAQANYTAFGLSAPQTSVGEVSVGSAGNERKLTNLAAGSAGTDAVNVNQLQAVAAQADNAILYDNLSKTTSTLAGPVSVDGGVNGGTTLTNLHQGAVNANSTDAVNGAQLFGVTQNLTAVDNSSVKYDNFLTKLSITLGGPNSADGGVTNGTTITNLHQGALTVNSTDAVNGAQLFSTNQSVTNIVNGTSGLVQQIGGAPGNGTITVGAATGGSLIDMTGTSGSRVVTGVSAGAVNAGSTDAINGSQLFGVSQSVTALDNSAVKYDNFLTKLSVTLGGPVSVNGGVSGGTTITNLHQGALTANSTDAVNGAQLFATNQAITNINTGTSGLVQQQGGSPGNGTITVGAATGGSLIDITGSGGSRTITGLSAGAVNAASTEAINGSQLFSVSQAVTTLDDIAVKYDSSLKDIITLGVNISNDGGITGGTTITNLHQGALTANSTDAVNGAQLFSTNQSITNIVNGTSGLVQQIGGAPGNGAITVGAATGGSLIDMTGTAGTRVVTGVSAGAVNAGSADAINGSQLFGVNQTITALDDSVVKYDSGSKTSITLGGPTSNNGGVTGGTSITNLHQGALTVNSTDAVNGAQLYATNQSITNITNGTSGLVQQTGGSPGNGAITVGAATGGSLVDMTGSGGTRVVTGVSAGAVNASSTDAVNGSQLFTLSQQITNINNNSGGTKKYFNANSTAADSQAGSDSVAVGPQTDAMGNSAVGMGNSANASGNDSIAVGHNSQATNTGSIAIGLNSQSSGLNTVAIGTGAVATNSVAVGAGAQAGNGGAAFGDNAIALAPQQGTALGNGATVTADRGVALGAGAQATRAGMNGASEKYSNAAVASTEGAVSVGSAGDERQITNVAGGTQATDAVNVRQLDAAVGTAEQYTDIQISQLRQDLDGVRKDASAGTASAIAMASMPQATLPGKSMLAAGVGNYNGQSALSIGISSLSDNGRWTIKGLASTDTRRNLAVGGGMGFHW